MKKNNNWFDGIYQRLATWIDSFEQHEMTNVVEIVERAKQYLAAAEQIPERKVKQFVDNLEQDLHEFYQQYQNDAQNSLYLGLLEERFWQSLSQITDKSQVEWAELIEDFQHKGRYQQGDMIGFGVLHCDRCQAPLTIYHLSEVPECPNCGHHEFIRQPFSP
jgi:hypothetical protein